MDHTIQYENFVFSMDSHYQAAKNWPSDEGVTLVMNQLCSTQEC